jgi:hypothetical protein
MTINGHQLPDAFLEAIRSGVLKREVGAWELRSECDAFGQPLETELAEVFDTADAIASATEELPEGFEANDAYGESLTETYGPSAIPDILDFSDIVCFGMAADGAPFCFDFRDAQLDPRVIWWDDVYWRVVAPNFAGFLALFDFEA